MKTNVRELSPSALARIAGVLYLIIAVAAIFAHMLIPQQFIVPGDAAATAANIAANDDPVPHRHGGQRAGHSAHAKWC